MLFDNETGAMRTDYDFEATTEGTSFIVESAMLDTLTESEIEDFLADPKETAAAVTEGILLEKTIVKMDKHAKQNRAYKSAIFIIAQEKNDPKFAKLLKCWKTERFLEAELEKKYGSEAQRRAKKAMADARKSGSYTLKKVGTSANVAPTTTFTSNGTGANINKGKAKAKRK